ncbi:MAG: ABC transporter transmembrane domain-containing protein [Rhodospirillaceae bacterium]|nr:ABC transporter transmembrane domain-containing protein [Rhodospirillaceae bacterium]
MEPKLFKYIWRHSKPDQVTILGIVVLSQLFYFLSLDVPKAIVNRAIQGDAFKDGATTTPFLNVSFTPPGFLAGLLGSDPITLFHGFELAQVPYLVALCLIFLLLVVINGLFKLQINTQKGRMGERMLRRLRYELFDRCLRFPQHYFRKVKSAEVATMIKDEVEPLGGFIGDAYVQPAFLGGQAITALAFILVQSVWLGSVAVAILAVQALVIPKLRKRVLILAKQRQLSARQLAGRVAEVIDGTADIHIHDTSNWERADVATRLGRIFKIRFDLYQWKFAIKFLNNLLAQFTPFLFYLVGGYLAIMGKLDIGQLVAVIAAYKDLPGPIKELIDWDQQRQDVQIKYEQVIEQFQPENMLSPAMQAISDQDAAPFDGALEINSLTLIDEAGHRPLDGLSVKVPLDQHVAVIGSVGSGRDILGPVLARLMSPTAGTIQIGGRRLDEMSEAVTGRRLSYAAADPYLFPVSVRENVIYGLRHRQRTQKEYDAEQRKLVDAFARETRRAGNPVLDIEADWIDYDAAGVDGPAALEDRLVEVLRIVELDEDVYRLGLYGRVDPETQPELAERLIRARNTMRERLADKEYAGLVESFDPERFNRNLSVGENLLFGTPVGDAFQPSRLATNAYVNQALQREELVDDVVTMGRRIAETMIELFADLPPGHPFFDQFSFIEADDLPEARALLARTEPRPANEIDAADRQRLMSLAFPYSEARHRLGLIDEAMEQRLLAARRRFAEELPDGLSGAIAFYNPDHYNAAASLQDNILFGRLSYGQAQAQQRVGALLETVLEEQALRRDVMRVGLDFEVGTQGKRLKQLQRQKIGLARAIIKRPDLLIVSEPLGAADMPAQRRILDQVLKARPEQGILWMLHRAGFAERFQRVLVMKDGKIVADGAPDKLDAPAYRELVEAA